MEQTERKLEPFRSLEAIVIPPNGWIHTIRKSLKMSLRQLGIRLSMAAQSVKEMEAREANGSISIKSLNEAARVLDMKLVYGFVSKHESLDKMIEKRAQEIAREIVLRTNNSMILEDQQNSADRIKKAIEQKTAEIKTEMPKYLWD
ncbi:MULTISPECIES: mobile mystery protein A [unclassified Flavobacterium]|nr:MULTISPECIES: mobile mystery protein A [unclassified Flavobacterium]